MSISPSSSAISALSLRTRRLDVLRIVAVKAIALLFAITLSNRPE